MPEVPSGLFTRFFSRSTAPAAPAAPPALVVRAAGRTTVGRRQNNQDALLVRPDLGVFAVADGMGGYEGGEIASTTTIDTLEALYELHRGDGDCTWPHVPDAELSLEAQRAIVAVGLAHRAVRAKREGALAQMGSTIVLATREGRHLVIAHAGDSRAYRVRRGVLTQLTRDHSFPQRARGASTAHQGRSGPHGGAVRSRDHQGDRQRRGARSQRRRAHPRSRRSLSLVLGWALGLG
jgi:serine/threonine protein phosphatase PrpC